MISEFHQVKLKISTKKKKDFVLVFLKNENTINNIATSKVHIVMNFLFKTQF